MLNSVLFGLETKGEIKFNPSDSLAFNIMKTNKIDTWTIIYYQYLENIQLYLVFVPKQSKLKSKVK